MMDFSTGRPVDYLGRSDYEDLRKNEAFTPGGIMTTIAIPLVAELAAESMLGDGKLSILGEAVGKKDLAKVARGGNITGNRLTQFIGNTDELKKVSSSQNKRVRGAINMRAITRGIGMVELLKVGFMLGGAAVDSVMSYRSAPKGVTLTSGSGIFNDTRAAQTQRQRAIQAIHNSQMTTRAALGNEAAFLHI